MNFEHSDEIELLEGCLAKDKKAWDTFVERYSRLILSAIVKTLRKHSIPPEDHVEDLYSNVFLSLLENNSRKIRQFQQRCRLSSWLYIIASHITLDQLRKLMRQPDIVSLNGETEEGVPLIEKTVNGQPLPDALFAREQIKRIIEEIKNRLTPREQLYWVLSNDHGLSPKEIADVLNTTANNVYQLKSLVMTKMMRMSREFL